MSDEAKRVADAAERNARLFEEWRHDQQACSLCGTLIGDNGQPSFSEHYPPCKQRMLRLEVASRVAASVTGHASLRVSFALEVADELIGRVFAKVEP